MYICHVECILTVYMYDAVCTVVFVQRREAEYDKYLRDKMVTAKNEFRSLLRETKVLNYK